MDNPGEKVEGRKREEERKRRAEQLLGAGMIADRCGCFWCFSVSVVLVSYCLTVLLISLSSCPNPLFVLFFL